jgi:hypothetical protein
MGLKIQRRIFSDRNGIETAGMGLNYIFEKESSTS